MSHENRTKGRYEYLVIVVFLVLELTYIVTVLAALKLTIPIDFISFYLAGRGYSDGVNIYDFEEIKQLADEHEELKEMADRFSVDTPVFPYLYPPVAAFYMQPLVRLNISAAGFLWLLTGMVLYGVILVMLLKMARTMLDMSEAASRGYLVLLWAIFISYVMPFKHSLFFGQVNTFVLTFIVASFFQTFHRRREVLGGALLAVATLVKVIPGILLIVFLLRRSWRVVAGFFIGALIIVAPTFLVTGGVSSWRNFLSSLSLTSHGGTIPGLFPPAEVFNFSIAGFYARLTDSPGTVRVLSLVTIGCLFALLLSQCGGLRRNSHVGLFLMPCLVLMVIASPLTYVHHVVFIYPGALLCVLSLVTRDVAGWQRFLVPAIVVLLLVASLPLPFLLKMAEAGGAVPVLVRSPNLYALLALFFLGLWILRMAVQKDRHEAC